MIDRKAQNLSAGTIRFYRVKLLVLADFCETQAITEVSQITPDVIRRWLMWLEERNHNPGGIHACYRTLKAFLRWYWAETEQAGNPPTARVKAPKVNLEPLQPIELDEVQALVKTCDKSLIGIRDKAIFYTLLDTGLRASELLALDLEDCELTTGATLVRHGKGGKSRTVFLSQATRRAIRSYLKARLDDNTALFATDEGTRLGYWGLRTLLDRRANMAGIQGVTLHSFRRQFALSMLRNGVDIFSLQELMGHADLQILRRYLAQTSDDLRQAHAIGSPVSRLRG